MRTKAVIKGIRKGAQPLIISGMETSVIEAMMYNAIPKGGVIMPIIKLKTTNRPK